MPLHGRQAEKNKRIKKGQVPAVWSSNKRRQKDTDARWTKKKNGKRFFGYKNHGNVDIKSKLIRDYAVTDAAVHGSHVFEALLDDSHTRRDVGTDSAYRSEEKLDHLEERRYREHLQRNGCRNKKLTAWERQGNRTRSKIRRRVAHVFGVQAQKAGNLILRTMGIARARAKIGLRNLAYKMDRYGMLVTA